MQNIAKDDNVSREWGGSPEPQRDPDREWLEDHTDLVAVNERLERLYGQQEWSNADRTYVKSLKNVFEVRDMPSFYRNQAYAWLSSHPVIRDDNDFLANMHQKLQRGEVLQFKQSDSLNRGVWKFMTEYERTEARNNRVQAQARYGKSDRPNRQRQGYGGGYQRPTVAGYPFEIAEAYLDYHRADADAFAGDYFHRQQRPQYHNTAPPSTY